MTELPQAYGYLRIRPNTEDGVLVVVEDQLRRCAETLGLKLVDTYYEEGPGIAPSRLVRKLIRDDVHHVIVPSLFQITEHPYLQVLVAETISVDAGAKLHEASNTYTQADAR